MIRCGIKDSEAFNKLNWREQIFFVRLMLSVDDYGRFEVKPEALRGIVFPLSSSKVPVRDVMDMILRCRELRLVELYTVEGKGYGRVLKFGQRLKHPRGRHPAAPSEQGELALGLGADTENEVAEELPARAVFEPTASAKRIVRNRSPERMRGELLREKVEVERELDEILRPGGSAYKMTPTGEKKLRYDELFARREWLLRELGKLAALRREEEAA